MIDAINPRTGRLVASLRAGGLVVDFVGTDEVVITTEDDAGVPRGVVQKIGLVRPP